MSVDWQSFGTFGIYGLASLLCMLGFILSCLSLSGTWAVLAATGLVAWTRWPDFPGWGTLATFLALCIITEILEAFAGTWGVQKRGGSKRAGLAAMFGGFLGMIFGGLIPIPIFGNLIGMILGSFACAYAVEHARLKHADHAAHIATGAVMARIGVIFLKTGITLAMIVILVAGTMIQ